MNRTVTPRGPRRGPRRTLAATGAALLTAAVLPLAAASPAAAHGNHQSHLTDLRQQAAAEGVVAPADTSGNVTLVASRPGSTAISGCFMKTKPIFVQSGLESVRVFGIADPRNPRLLATLPNAVFENEAMTCGERRTADGVRRFALIGVDSYQASPTDPQHVNVGGNELIVVDVTKPAEPFIASRTPATTSTHTVACVVQVDCRFAYSAGNGDKDEQVGTFSILDLRKLGNPREVDARPGTDGVQPFRSPAAGHKWNFDNSGHAIHTGWRGSAIFDVSRPLHPRVVTTTGQAGIGTDPDHPGWNDFIHHNSLRPNAREFSAGARAGVQNGNVLFVTEEDYEQTDCSKAGSFQSWKVTRLDGTPAAIKPLDKVELADLGTFPSPVGGFCSSHWFDYHPSGIAAVGFYGGGLQLIDTRDPRDLKSYGHAVGGVSEVWDSLWVPRYTEGKIRTGRTNVVYVIDAVRGLEVYSVDLPGAGDRLSTAQSRSTPSPDSAGRRTRSRSRCSAPGCSRLCCSAAASAPPRAADPAAATARTGARLSTGVPRPGASAATSSGQSRWHPGGLPVAVPGRPRGSPALPTVPPSPCVLVGGAAARG